MAYIYFIGDREPLQTEESLVHLSERTRVEQFIQVTAKRGWHTGAIIKGNQVMINRDCILFIGGEIDN